MTHAITIDNLSYRAGQHFAIRDLRMRVPNGSVYGFLSPNGSGKTTTLRLLLGMLPPADGTITVLGHEVPRGAHHALAQIGYVPERLHLYPMLTVAETMRHHASFYPTWNATEAERLRDLAGVPRRQRRGAVSRCRAFGRCGTVRSLLALVVGPRQRIPRRGRNCDRAMDTAVADTRIRRAPARTTRPNKRPAVALDRAYGRAGCRPTTPASAFWRSPKGASLPIGRAERLSFRAGS
ncbi:MAG: ATP-binding cassette domain-containing protein, partial [Acidobacteria bacterium]|nr:ATP-binding cassette domain-containing protein [Acidobacteriota bacterium]